MIIWRLVDSFRSQFFQSRRHFSNHAKERSTTHRLGMTLNVWSSLLFTTSTVAPIACFTAWANFSPEYPPSTSIVSTAEKFSVAWLTKRSAPSRSVTLAVETAIPCGKPFVSTAMCRLMPDTFFPASYPFSLAQSVFFTLCASTMTMLVLALRPLKIRASPTDFF